MTEPSESAPRCSTFHVTLSQFLFPLLWPRTLKLSGPQVDFIPYIHKHPSPSSVAWVTTFPVILNRSLLVVILFSEVISAFLFFLIFCGAAWYQDEISKDPKGVFSLTFRNSTWPRMISEKITTSQTTTCTRIPFLSCRLQSCLAKGNRGNWHFPKIRNMLRGDSGRRHLLTRAPYELGTLRAPPASEELLWAKPVMAYWV